VFQQVNQAVGFFPFIFGSYVYAEDDVNQWDIVSHLQEYLQTVIQHKIFVFIRIGTPTVKYRKNKDKNNNYQDCFFRFHFFHPFNVPDKAPIVKGELLRTCHWSLVIG
jgi:hypothetical protein